MQVRPSFALVSNLVCNVHVQPHIQAVLCSTNTDGSVPEVQGALYMLLNGRSNCMLYLDVQS